MSEENDVPVGHGLGTGVWSVYDDVYAERRRQNRLRDEGKFSETAHEMGKAGMHFLALGVLGEEFGEVARCLNEGALTTNELREELVQVAAVAIAWVEGIDAGRRGGES